MRQLVTGLMILGFLSTGCSSDPTTSDQYVELEQDLAAVEQQLATVTAERDALDTSTERLTDRYDRAAVIQEEIMAILADPYSFSTEAETADLLATHATEDAVMDDDVFGAVNYRQGFYNTLYSGMVDAKIDVYHHWLTDDGSQGGFLWVWYGTNAAGNPFELAGISLTEHDEKGLIAYELVAYPYPDEYVDDAVFGAGN